MASTSKMITLKSSDDQEFEVEEAVVLQSQTIKHMVEDDCANNTIPLPNVTGSILSKVIEYCKAHHHKKEEEEELKNFDTGFLKVIELPVVFELILAANFLNIKGLLDITCQSVADRIKEKRPEEIRQIFNIVNDFTPEEEAEVRKENQWAFE